MTIRTTAVDPATGAGSLLPGAQYADAFAIDVAGTGLDARHAADKMMAARPRWVEQLMTLRNRLVAPFGLKTEADAADAIGIFPVISETLNRLVLGFDDKHLDFRVVVDVAPSAGGQRVTATTVVLTHNLLGRVYLAVILPFHKLIARTLLRQVAD